LATTENSPNPSAGFSETAKDLRWTKNGIETFGAISGLALIIYCLQFALHGTWQMLVGILGSGLLIAVASFLLGTLLGFIFAIPKALQHPASDQGGATPTAKGGGADGGVYQVNTNLEQISDWLTKILVGVGLVQLAKVPEYATRLGAYFKRCLGDSDCSPAIAVTLIVGFLAFGFLAGYLVTRIYVTGALKRAESSVMVQPGQRAVQLSPGTSGGPSEPPISDVGP